MQALTDGPWRSNAGVDIILNKESTRETPSVVTFNQKQRQIGTDAGGSCMEYFLLQGLLAKGAGVH